MQAAICCKSFPTLPFAGRITLCQDPVGWKAPIRHHSPSNTPNGGPTTPAKQQHPAGLGVQLDQDMQPAQDDDVDVDSPTATANGPAVQAVSVEKKKKKLEKAAAKRPEGASGNGQAGAAAQEDPEKKAKKVNRLNVHHRVSCRCKEPRKTADGARASAYASPICVGCKAVTRVQPQLRTTIYCRI